MLRYFRSVGGGLATASLVTVGAYFVAAVTSGHPQPWWPYVLLSGLMVLGGLSYVIGQHRPRTSASEAATRPAELDSEPTRPAAEARNAAATSNENAVHQNPDRLADRIFLVAAERLMAAYSFLNDTHEPLSEANLQALGALLQHLEKRFQEIVSEISDPPTLLADSIQASADELTVARRQVNVMNFMTAKWAGRRNDESRAASDIGSYYEFLLELQDKIKGCLKKASERLRALAGTLVQTYTALPGDRGSGALFAEHGALDDAMLQEAEKWPRFPAQEAQVFQDAATTTSPPQSAGSDVPVTTPKQEQLPEDNLRYVPVLGEAGPGEEVPVPAELGRKGSIFAVRVVGNSMAGDGVSDGDYVTVDTNAEVNDGDIAVIILEPQSADAHAVIKRIHFEGTAIRLEPSHPDYSPMILEKDSEAIIAGKVIGVFRNDGTWHTET